MSAGPRRDADSACDRPPHAMSTAGVAHAAAVAHAIVPANASAIVAPSAYVLASSLGASSGRKAKAFCQPQKSRVKRMVTKTSRSRLAVEGAPSALTTPEASSSGGGLQLLQSLGFDFKHATPFKLFISYF